MRGLIPALAVVIAASACSAADSDPPEAVPTAPAPATATTSAPAPAGTEPPPPSTTSPSPTTSAAPPSVAPTTAPATAEPSDSPEREAAAGNPPVRSYSGVGDSLYPLLGNGGYDVVHYYVELDIDPVRDTVEGYTQIEAVATRNLGRLHLDFSGMDVHDVVVSANKTEFQRQGTELILWPEGVIRSGTSFNVEVRYSGTPERIEDPGVPFAPIGWFSIDDVIFTASQPSGAMTWFPSNNHPSDKARFTFRIKVPEEFQVAATGVYDGESVFGGVRDVMWLMQEPMATYLAAVYVGDFERHEQRIRDDLLVRDYIPAGLPDSEREAMLEALSVTPRAIEFFEGLLGRYPFDAYGTVVLPLAFGFAMENQTLSLHSTQTLGAQIIAHELAHQWFGNSVTLDDWSEIWLHEGFAHYLSLVYLAEVHGEDLDALMARELEAAKLSEPVPPMGISIEQLFDFDVVYRRGALALHALHRFLGDDAFFGLLRSHHDRAAGGNTNTEEFLASVELAGGARGVELLRSWLYDPLVPEEFSRSTG